MRGWMAGIGVAVLAAGGWSGAAVAQAPIVACPPVPTRVVQPGGRSIEYLGTVPGIPQLCRMKRADGDGDFYYGGWRSDWPGAGQAFPALYAVLSGPPGTKATFVTRSIPGMQWNDTLTNEGFDTLEIDGQAHRTLKIAHERDGIEGNTYHSIITSWRDTTSGATLKVVENQISGQSYGPQTTWTALRVEAIP